MSGAVDISREACGQVIQDLAAFAIMLGGAPAIEAAQFQIEALRAALDAAERERDEARNAISVIAKAVNYRSSYQAPLSQRVVELAKAYDNFPAERDAADATGYARGLRDAAVKAQTWLDAFGSFEPEHVTPQKWASDAVADIHDAILALLPKEKTEKKEEEREVIYRHPEGWIDGDFE